MSGGDFLQAARERGFVHQATDEAALAASRGVLARFGNMSSATLMFVLADMLAQTVENGVAVAFGPGLAAEGFAVDSASNGPDGLRQARSGDFDAVVLDVMLPGMSGYEVVRRLRAEDNWVPVLMLSAKDGEHDQADALDDGADDYLTKPFSFPVLVARLRAAGVSTTVRDTRGQDIDGACGQLAAADIAANAGIPRVALPTPQLD